MQLFPEQSPSISHAIGNIPTKMERMKTIAISTINLTVCSASRIRNNGKNKILPKILPIPS